MANNGVTELRRLLAMPVNSEGDVVHILVEIRKVVETMGKRFPVLKFFCDWPLHAVLDQNNAKLIMKMFDELVSESRKNGGYTPKALMDKVRPLVDFTSFQSDLVAFLGEHDLDIDLAADVERYTPFLFLYVSKIQHTPLRATNLKTLDTITVAHLPVPPMAPGEPDHNHLFSLQWVFQKGGQDTFSFINEIWSPIKPMSVQVPLVELPRFWE